jgi:hypothetical protein
LCNRSRRSAEMLLEQAPQLPLTNPEARGKSLHIVVV